MDPSIEEQELLADTFRLSGGGFTPRDRLAELLLGAGFIAAAAALWLAHPPHALNPGPLVLCAGLMVLATLVRFDTPFGFTVATQLAFVPLLFATPLALVAPVVVLTVLAARIPELVTGKIHPSRLLLALGNSWFALGPVAVFALAGTEPGHAGPLLLLAALVAQFAVDITVSTVRLWIARDAPLASQFGDTWVYAIDTALSGVGLVIAEDIHRTVLSAVAIVPLLGLLAMFAHERHHRLQSLIELGNAYRGTALVLGDVVEADDGYTGEHCKSVVGLALELAEHLGLSGERRRNLEFGALLHDVGKVAIAKEIINKPGRLDPEEWQVIRTHTIEGQKMLDRIGGFMSDVGMIVRSHHERWDGSGYPDGLAGEGIPLEARIIACCDTWNAMRTDRVYRRALTHETAAAELRAAAGSQLDPRLVDAMIEMVDPRPEESAQGIGQESPLAKRQQVAPAAV